MRQPVTTLKLLLRTAQYSQQQFGCLADSHIQTGICTSQGQCQNHTASPDLMAWRAAAWSRRRCCTPIASAAAGMQPGLTACSAAVRHTAPGPAGPYQSHLLPLCGGYGGRDGPPRGMDSHTCVNHDAKCSIGSPQLDKAFQRQMLQQVVPQRIQHLCRHAVPHPTQASQPA